MKNIIGRKKEKELLQRIVESTEAEFLVVYGRRRVGKTFLIKEFFQNKFDFYFSGVENSTMKKQLENFTKAFYKHFNFRIETPQNWTSAFDMLEQSIEKIAQQKKTIIFIDELPWLDTKNSGFIQAFEYWWNTYASSKKNILLIICGSATSWIINKLLKNRGGLHNRVTRQIKLEQFTLSECYDYSLFLNLRLSKIQILDYYMIFGGVPYYWKQINKRNGLPGNVDALFFNQAGVLRGEFSQIYDSLYKNSKNYIKIVNALGTKRMGLLRDEIAKKTKLSGGGNLSKMLEELEQCGFIRSYYGFDKKSKDKLYQLVDFFSLFSLNFIRSKNNKDENYWTNNINTSKINAWKGYAFEQVCLSHLPQIKKKLGISGVITSSASWRSKDAKQGAQIDLIIDRADNVINLCEMKYSNKEFTITKDYDENLCNKLGAFIEETKTRKSVHITMVSTFGISHNMYRNNIQSEVTLDDLFE
jgi:AAA+ ATPase superfamily predicted ATPase